MAGQHTWFKPQPGWFSLTVHQLGGILTGIGRTAQSAGAGVVSVMQTASAILSKLGGGGHLRGKKRLR